MLLERRRSYRVRSRSGMARHLTYGGLPVTCEKEDGRVFEMRKSLFRTHDAAQAWAFRRANPEPNRRSSSRSRARVASRLCSSNAAILLTRSFVVGSRPT